MGVLLKGGRLDSELRKERSEPGRRGGNWRKKRSPGTGGTGKEKRTRWRWWLNRGAGGGEEVQPPGV